MAALENHLWRHVLSTATERVSDFSGIHSALGKSKIGDLDMAIMIYQEVFGFKIPVNDVLLMKVHKAVHYLNKIKPGMFLTHSLDRLQVVEKLSAGAVV
jgi:hypothetical protein